MQNISVVSRRKDWHVSWLEMHWTVILSMMKQMLFPLEIGWLCQQFCPPLSDCICRTLPCVALGCLPGIFF